MKDRLGWMTFSDFAVTTPHPALVENYLSKQKGWQSITQDNDVKLWVYGIAPAFSVPALPETLPNAEFDAAMKECIQRIARAEDRHFNQVMSEIENGIPVYVPEIIDYQHPHIQALALAWHKNVWFAQDLIAAQLLDEKESATVTREQWMEWLGIIGEMSEAFQGVRTHKKVPQVEELPHEEIG